MKCALIFTTALAVFGFMFNPAAGVIFPKVVLSNAFETVENSTNSTDSPAATFPRYLPAPIVRPTKTLKWAMPIEIALHFEAGYIYAGLVAAFNQHNKKANDTAAGGGRLSGVDYAVEVYPLHHSVYSLIPEPFTDNFVLNGDTEYFGFAGSRILSDYFLTAFGQLIGLPTIGNQPLFSPKPYANWQISLRASASSDMAQLMNFAFHSSDTLCAKSAIFALTIDNGERTAEYLRQTGASEPYLSFRPAIESDVDYAVIFAVIADNDVNCIFINDIEDVVYSLIKGFETYLPADRFARTSFFAGSGGVKAEYTSAADKVTFRNLFATQTSPDPQDLNMPLAKDFRSAMSDPDVASIVNAQLVFPSVTRSLTPNFVSFEGYIIGRYILETLANTPSVTR